MDREIHFDTDGITDECPEEGTIKGYMTSDGCLSCQWNRGHHGFTTFCGYIRESVNITISTGLNQKLAKWLGWEIHQILYPDGYTEFVRWMTPEGKVDGSSPPNFTESLDTCFKHLVPKLKSYHITSRPQGCHLAVVWTNEPQRGIDKNPALALCLAIGKLIDADMKEEA